MEAFAILFLCWIACGFLGGLVASQKAAGVLGFCVALLFGPLGVLAAFALDGRRTCQRCGVRLNGDPEVCPACQITRRNAGDASHLLTEAPDREFLDREREAVERIRQRRAARKSPPLD